MTAPPPESRDDTREMYAEISTLLGHLGTALEMEPDAVAALLEQGALDLRMETDEAGCPCVAVTHGTGADRREARIYKDTILHRGTPPGDAGPAPLDTGSKTGRG
ncbi:hypothetical protein F1188_14880 [Roseospira marina]|uniref:Uncharacterized protein n=1 Tax=Roseospira marina TaxID=140057 RepID=A0A5M6I8V6_9PROT|nr:hypothetical protein [Roseospira marina]KAA5604694.1 hypothetical protein F1188_14880 [Roseospira marina]MBB4315142.1 hypothetical protein [Roseospira marina]MBB5088088.1 hypothetical protein [Roseospira marina]